MLFSDSSSIPDHGDFEESTDSTDNVKPSRMPNIEIPQESDETLLGNKNSFVKNTKKATVLNIGNKTRVNYWSNLPKALAKVQLGDISNYIIGSLWYQKKIKNLEENISQNKLQPRATEMNGHQTRLDKDDFFNNKENLQSKTLSELANEKAFPSKGLASELDLFENSAITNKEKDLHLLHIASRNIESNNISNHRQRNTTRLDHLLGREKVDNNYQKADDILDHTHEIVINPLVDDDEEQSGDEPMVYSGHQSDEVKANMKLKSTELTKNRSEQDFLDHNNKIIVRADETPRQDQIKEDGFSPSTDDHDYSNNRVDQENDILDGGHEIIIYTNGQEPVESLKGKTKSERSKNRRNRLILDFNQEFVIKPDNAKMIKKHISSNKKPGLANNNGKKNKSFEEYKIINAKLQEVVLRDKASNALLSRQTRPVPFSRSNKSDGGEKIGFVNVLDKIPSDKQNSYQESINVSRLRTPKPHLELGFFAIPFSPLTKTDNSEPNNQKHKQGNLVKIEHLETMTEPHINKIGYLGRTWKLPVSLEDKALSEPQSEITSRANEHETSRLSVYDKYKKGLQKLVSGNKNLTEKHFIKNISETTGFPFDHERKHFQESRFEGLDRLRNGSRILRKLPSVSNNQNRTGLRNKKLNAKSSASSTPTRPPLYVLLAKSILTEPLANNMIKSQHNGDNRYTDEIAGTMVNKIDLNKFSLGHAVIIPILTRQKYKVKSANKDGKLGKILSQKAATNVFSNQENPDGAPNLGPKLATPVLAVHIPVVYDRVRDQGDSKVFPRPLYVPMSVGKSVIIFAW